MVVNHKSLNPFCVQELENEKISRTFHGRLLWNMGSDTFKMVDDKYGAQELGVSVDSETRVTLEVISMVV